MIIAITGSISCGKSLVSSYLIKKGYSVIDADKITHNILTNKNVIDEITNNFGHNILENNKISRKKLANLVFNNKKKLDILNKITHPKIKKIIKQRILNSNDKIIFLDIALLYEADFLDLVDKVIVVHTDKDIQISRLIKRNNYTTEEALVRINNQLSSIEKSKLADYVIDNSYTVENTYLQIEKILVELERN